MARHPDDVLKAMATEHVRYEVEMMVNTARLSVPSAEVLALEAYLLHCRNLAEFVTSTSPRATDLVAQDYFDAPWAGVQLPADFDMAAIHRRLAHLTTERLTTNVPGQGFSWAAPVGDRARRAVMIRHAFGRFLGDLWQAHPDRASWFDDSWQCLRALR